MWTDNMDLIPSPVVYSIKAPEMPMAAEQPGKYWKGN